MKKFKLLALSEEEVQLILDKREALEQGKPKKIGFLKHDLFVHDAYHFNSGNINVNKYDVYSIADIDYMTENFRDSFEVALPKGTEFICYIDGKKEQWYDNINYGIENRNSIWAKKHLINITNI